MGSFTVYTGTGTVYSRGLSIIYCTQFNTRWPPIWKFYTPPFPRAPPLKEEVFWEGEKGVEVSR